MRKLCPLLFACLIINAWAAPPESVNLDTKTKTVINPLVIFGASTTIDVTDANKIGFPGATFTFIQSINFDDITNRVSLVNDLDTPGSLMYYGTDGSGLLGYHQLTCNFTWGLIAGTLSNQTDLQAALDAKEPALGNPSVNGYVLSSTTTGTRSWIANGTGGGGGAWGSITGTLSDQTDLQSALNAKVSGSIADKQVAYGNATDIAGSDNFQWDNANKILVLTAGSADAGNNSIELYDMNGVKRMDFYVDESPVSTMDLGAGDNQITFTSSDSLARGQIGGILLDGVAQTIAANHGSVVLDGNTNTLFLTPSATPPSSMSEGTFFGMTDHHAYYYNGTTSVQLDNAGGGGDVVGPGSATDNAVARFDGTTGKLIQNSGVTIDDSGNLTATNVSGTNTGDQTTISGNAGTATKWATARNLAGNSVDGSANVAFANKFIVQGTADSGLSAAQFLGALGTGLVKNTTTTGVLSIAAASDVVGLFTSCSGTQYLGADGACHTAAGSGDFSSNTSTSVDSEFVVFSGTGGKTGKRATGTGLVTATSGVMGTVTAPSGTVVGTSDTQTLTNKRITKRVFSSATPGATPAVNTDNYDVVTLTAINAAITSMSSNLTGSPNEGDSITYWIHDDGSARAIAWGASFGALQSVTLPTTTVVGHYIVVTFYYSGLIPIWIGTGAGQY